MNGRPTRPRLSRQDALPDGGIEIQHVPPVPDERVPILADNLVIVPLGVQVEGQVLLAALIELGGGAQDLAGGGEQVPLDSFDARTRDGVAPSGPPDVADDLLLEGLELGHRLGDVYLGPAD